MTKLLQDSVSFAAQSSDQQTRTEAPVKHEFVRKPHHWKPGQSGNPKGRPRGINFRALVEAKCEETGHDLGEAMWQVYLAVHTAALCGDMQAAKLLLDRLCTASESAVDIARMLSTTERAARVQALLAMAEERMQQEKELDEIL